MWRGIASGVTVPEFNLVRASTMSCIFIASYTEAATPVNGPAVGDRPWLRRTNCGDAKCRRYSPSVATVHSPGEPSMAAASAAALGPGDRLWETIGSVTGPIASL